MHRIAATFDNRSAQSVHVLPASCAPRSCNSNINIQHHHEANLVDQFGCLCMCVRLSQFRRSLLPNVCSWHFPEVGQAAGKTPGYFALSLSLAHNNNHSDVAALQHFPPHKYTCAHGPADCRATTLHQLQSAHNAHIWTGKSRSAPKNCSRFGDGRGTKL